jgi:hypothetical protein
MFDTDENTMAYSGTPVTLDGDGVETEIAMDSTAFIDSTSFIDIDRIEFLGGSNKFYVTSVELYDDCYIGSFSSSSSSKSSSSISSSSESAGAGCGC